MRPAFYISVANRVNYHGCIVLSHLDMARRAVEAWLSAHARPASLCVGLTTANDFMSYVNPLCGQNNGGRKMDLMTFVTLIVLAFAIVMIAAGAFAAILGSGKSRAFGGVMAVIGLIVCVVWAYLVGWSDVSPFCEVELYETVYNAVVNLIGVVIGALVAVGIFMVVVLKS